MRNLAISFSGLAIVLLATPAAAQRGRGRSEAIINRIACFFADGKVDQPAGDADPLQGIGAVREAAAAHHPLVLYLFDPKTDAKKHEAYEQTMFNMDELGAALRCFACVRVDVTSESSLAKYAPRAPVFVAFDQDGKSAGEVAQTGYKAALKPLTTLLEKAASGRGKTSLPVFVQSYRDLVHDFEQLEFRRKAIADRQSRLADKDVGKKAELAKEEKELDAESKRLDEREKDLLEGAKAPPRLAGAKRVGERRDRGR